MSQMSTGPAALLARGLAVFPIRPGEKAAPPGWHGRASADPAQQWPVKANIGVACRPSAIVVLDLDRKHDVDGVTTLTGLCAVEGQPWPDTLTVATANNGLHLYFAAPAHRVVASTIGVLGPGIDVRAPGHTTGGYVVGPGSVVDGRAYRIEEDLPIASLPDWLLRRLSPPATTVRLGAKTGDIQIATRRAAR